MMVIGLFEFLARSAFGSGGVSMGTVTVVEVDREVYRVKRVRFEAEHNRVVIEAETLADSGEASGEAG